MCGICGRFHFADNRPVDREVVRRMTSSIAHRGPDDEGYHFDGPLGLGFRRLSIIDLEGGHQPMSDAEESVWVIFNGEIYNYRELRDQLRSKGHRFRTDCDTEVIVHGYKEWGDQVFNRLNGMFGVAIWDVRKRRLVLARDRYGIKLVYYRIQEGTLDFGSEMRAVRAAGPEGEAVDPLALYLFLRFRYTPSPHTIVKGIHKLAPGSMLVAQDGKTTIRRWYRYRPKPFKPPKSQEEAIEELEQLYRDSIARHLIADVPVGLLLSGGMDSALLLALMKESGGTWPTYTVGYGESFEDDELTDAAETARQLGQPNHQVLLDRQGFEKALPDIVSCLEEPIAASSIVPMYFVCERARQDVKVALVGQGPDELFGGYKRHLGVRYGNYWRALPGFLRRPASAAVRLFPRQEALKRGVDSLGEKDRLNRYQQVFSLLPGNQLAGLFHDDLLPADHESALLDCWQGLGPMLEETDELGGFQFLEVRSSLPDELLMYADKLSMAHGLEVRVPYLDREIVEYVERLPAQLKVHRTSRKWLHRQVCRRFLPEEILRRKKRGFAVNVVDDWFDGTVGSGMEEILRDEGSHLYSFIKPSSVHQRYQAHIRRQADHHKLLFSLVVLESWLRHQGTPVDVLG